MKTVDLDDFYAAARTDADGIRENAPRIAAAARAIAEAAEVRWSKSCNCVAAVRVRRLGREAWLTFLHRLEQDFCEGAFSCGGLPLPRHELDPFCDALQARVERALAEAEEE